MKASNPLISKIPVCAFAIMAMLSLILFGAPLFAQMMGLPVDLSYLSQRADIIVQGKVQSVRNEPLPGYSHIPTIAVTLEVEKMLRGPSVKTFTFREILLDRRPKLGKHGYEAGQRLFLFLPSPSAQGVSSPIGMEQGRFHIARDAAGAETIINEVGNSGLFKNVAQKASNAGAKLTPNQLRTASTKGGPVHLDEFISLTQKLTSLPRIK